MKILVVHNKYQSKNKGGEDIVYENELLSLQSELGKENVFSYVVSNDNFNIFELIFNILFSIKHYNNIKKIVIENDINIVHVHNFFPLLTPSIFKAAKEGGAKVVHTLHNYRLWCISGTFYRDGYGICEICTKSRFSFQGILNKCFRKSLLQSILTQSSFWFYRFSKIFDNIDYFFALTTFQKEKIKSLGVKDKAIILKPNSLQITGALQNKKDGYIYVGRFEESKGLLILLNIWRKLDKKFVLTIIGTGDNEDKLKKDYQSSNIIFKGMRSREHTLNCISKSKYLIQSSVLYETFGLTIIEAMAYGVPVIGFDIGTRRNFIKNNVNGFLCEKHKLEDIIKKSFNFCEYETLSKNALLDAKEFDNSLITKKQIKIYENIIGTYFKYSDQKKI
jgi:glycosyltransferase involved in cell wall biosynthesis